MHSFVGQSSIKELCPPANSQIEVLRLSDGPHTHTLDKSRRRDGFHLSTWLYSVPDVIVYDLP